MHLIAFHCISLHFIALHSSARLLSPKGRLQGEVPRFPNIHPDICHLCRSINLGCHVEARITSETKESRASFKTPVRRKVRRASLGGWIDIRKEEEQVMPTPLPSPSLAFNTAQSQPHCTWAIILTPLGVYEKRSVGVWWRQNLRRSSSGGAWILTVIPRKVVRF